MPEHRLPGEERYYCDGAQSSCRIEIPPAHKKGGRAARTGRQTDYYILSMTLSRGEPCTRISLPMAILPDGAGPYADH